MCLVQRASLQDNAAGVTDSKCGGVRDVAVDLNVSYSFADFQGATINNSGHKLIET